MAASTGRDLSVEILFVGQAHQHRELQSAGSSDRFRGGLFADEVEVGALVHVEVGLDLVVGDDGGQDGVVGLDEVAGIGEPAADAAAQGARTSV